VIWKILVQIVWGFPQTLAGAVLLAYNWATGKIVAPPRWVGHGFQTCVGKHWGGISLGLFSFRDGASLLDDNTIRHEDGHSVQSIMFGPAYLIIVGIPSLRNALDKNLVGDDYYTVWPENQADKLGGVKR